MDIVYYLAFVSLHTDSEYELVSAFLLINFTQHDILPSSICVLGKSKISSPLIAKKYSMVYIYHIFSHSSVVEPLGCFQVLAIVNSTAVSLDRDV